MRNVRLASLLSLALASVSLAACDHVTTGAHGALTFTPGECGQTICSLDDELAVGGTTLVTVDEADGATGVDAARATLFSSDPSVVQVALVERGSFDATYRLIGTGHGIAELIAIDELGHEIDHTIIEVIAADALEGDLLLGVTRGAPRDGFDEVWVVKANSRAHVEVAPYRSVFRLMGEVRYRVDIDEVLFAGQFSDAKVELGVLRFSVPTGEYPVRFTAPDGHTLDALVVAQ